MDGDFSITEPPGALICTGSVSPTTPVLPQKPTAPAHQTASFKAA